MRYLTGCALALVLLALLALFVVGPLWLGDRWVLP